MFRQCLIAFTLFCVSSAQAAHEGLVLNDIRSKSGVQLLLDDLNQLMPNAKVVHYLATGSTRRWINEPDGKFVANSDGCGQSGVCRPGSAQGTWHIASNGTYCVSLEWRTSSENWCYHMFKVGEKYYGVRSVSNGTATAIGFEFSK